MFRSARNARRAALLVSILAVLTAAVLGAAAAIAGAGPKTPEATPAAVPAAIPTLFANWRVLPHKRIAIDAGRTSVWTGKDLIVTGWTGAAPDGNLLAAVDSAIAYNVPTMTWRRLAAPPRTDTYCGRSAAWTGKEMLVWGCSLVAFDPAKNRWQRLPDSPTRHGIAVWTGHELVGWGGGCCGDVSDDGSGYNPATSTWRKLSPAPVGGQQAPVGAWTGRELVILDGHDPEGNPVGGAAYNPATDTWRRISPMPVRLTGADAVWNGREILVVGNSNAAFAYNPEANRWRALPQLPERRFDAAAVWTGRELVIWGGTSDRIVYPRAGLAYDPKLNRWSRLSSAPLPGRADPVVAWTGHTLLVWGGSVPTSDGRTTRHLSDGAVAGLHGSRPLPVCCGG